MTNREHSMLLVYLVTLIVLGGLLVRGIANCSP